MIKTINSDILDTNANFIINFVNSTGKMDSQLARALEREHPHIDIQYRKYINYCKKNRIQILGTCQYVPIDSWAIGLVDTMKNHDVYNYDEPYQFIVNMFIYKDKKRIDIDALYSGLKNLRQKARMLKPVIAFPYGKEVVGNDINWSEAWKEVNKAINSTLGRENKISVLICK